MGCLWKVPTIESVQRIQPLRYAAWSREASGCTYHRACDVPTWRISPPNHVQIRGQTVLLSRPGKTWRAPVSPTSITILYSIESTQSCDPTVGLMEYLNLRYTMKYDYLGDIIASLHSRCEAIKELQDRLSKVQA